MFKKIPLLLTLIFPLTCLAQFSITGRALNQVDTRPVANASVLLSGATVGGKTGEDGTFQLKNVAPGKYDLVISIVGFETYTQAIVVSNANINLSDVIIFPKSTALNTVTIRVDKNRERNFTAFYDRFKSEFFGRSEFADYCKILNPDLLDFSFNDTTNTFSASSADFLQIENGALGYKLNYLLTNFQYNNVNRNFTYQGPVLFTEMKGSLSQQRNWTQNRKITFEESTLQFLRSILNDGLEEDGFRVLQIAVRPNPERPADSALAAKLKQFDVKSGSPGYNRDSLSYWKKKLSLKKTVKTLEVKPLTKADVVFQTKEPGVFALGSDKNDLVIMYDKSHHFIEPKQLADSANLSYILNKTTNKDVTLIRFNDPYIFFDSNGRILNPNGVIYYGAWSKNRVAELLPIDYQPENNRIILADSVITGLKNKIAAYSKKYSFEKIHLHFDRPRYSLGDTIWFKAYVLAGSDHMPSGISALMYTELFNQNDSLMSRLILPLDSGVSRGNFAIGANFKPGNYHVRAYTKWMQNDSNYYFDQRINIGGIPETKDVSANTSISKLPVAAIKSNAVADVQFFPESGDLIDGLRSKVAFKISGTDGSAREAHGSISDESGNEVAVLQTSHLGMGNFPLTPQPGKHYKAKITFSDSSSFIYDLPQAKERGFVLTVNNVSDSIYVKVAMNETLFNSKRDSCFYLIMQSEGRVYYTAKASTKNKVFTARIENTRFPSGILQLTLFSQNGEPLNERVIFIRNADPLKLNLSLPAKNFFPYSEVKLDLNAMSYNRPISGSFSVAVTDETKVPVDEASENTIFTDLLLTSQLKGRIENPNYYFKEQNDQTRADLDLLMLTQGYRRFEWKKILTYNKIGITQEAEKSLGLSGRITTFDGKPVAHGKVRLSSILYHFSVDTLTDANGHFTFTDINLPDSAKVIINAQNEAGSNKVKISIDKPAFPNISKSAEASNSVIDGGSPAVIRVLAQTYTESRKTTLKNAVELREVKINAKRNDYFNPTYSYNMKYSTNLNGPGNANQVILGDKFSGCINLAECLAGKTFGLTWQNGTPYSNRAAVRHLIGPGGGSGAQPMAVFIDGIQRGPGDLVTIDPLNVYSVEVLTSISYLTIYGSNAPNGAIIVTMKRGSDIKSEPVAVDGLITYTINGYSSVREFYSPKYTSTDTHQTLDERKTVYWNPDVITGTDGKASVVFFNTGQKGRYRVVVEGIDGYGNPARQVYSYNVE